MVQLTTNSMYTYITSICHSYIPIFYYEMFAPSLDIILPGFFDRAATRATQKNKSDEGS